MISTLSSKANCIMHVSDVRTCERMAMISHAITWWQVCSTLTYSIIEIERFDLTTSLNMILQASRWSDPIAVERSWSANDFSDVSSGRRFNNVQRSWLTEWTFKLMNRNVPSRTCKSISISRVDCDFELTLALSRSDRNINWERKRIQSIFLLIALGHSLCCPLFSPHNVMLPTCK